MTCGGPIVNRDDHAKIDGLKRRDSGCLNSPAKRLTAYRKYSLQKIHLSCRLTAYTIDVFSANKLPVQ